ncbi:unnamed protein product [Ixodes persulcatus]
MTHEGYQVSVVAEWFHVVPHVDIGFAPVNSTFDPSSNVYLETQRKLLRVTLRNARFSSIVRIKLVYAKICFCGNLRNSQWTLQFFFFVNSAGALALGLFGNDQAHGGMVAVQKSTQDMEDSLSSMGNQTRFLDRSLGQSAQQELSGLALALAGPLSDPAARNLLDRSLELMKGNLSVGAARAQELQSRVGHLTLSPLPRALQLVELFRWPATIGLLCVLILVCLLLLWGVIRHSRCLLILFSVLGLLSVVLCWVMVSLYLGICVAGSDFCLDPEPFLQKQSSGMLDSVVLGYYLHCGDDVTSPFIEPLRDARGAVDGLQTLLVPVTHVADRYFPRKEVHSLLSQLGQELNSTQTVLAQLGLLLDCPRIHQQYRSAMGATCTGLLEGTAFMLASAAGAGLLFTVLIWVASHTWIHIRQRRPREALDEEDPFLPPSAVGGAAARRSRDTNGRSASREEQAFLQARYTPPPTVGDPRKPCAAKPVSCSRKLPRRGLQCGLLSARNLACRLQQTASSSARKQPSCVLATACVDHRAVSRETYFRLNILLESMLGTLPFEFTICTEAVFSCSLKFSHIVVDGTWHKNRRHKGESAGTPFLLILIIILSLTSCLNNRPLNEQNGPGDCRRGDSKWEKSQVSVGKCD